MIIFPNQKDSFLLGIVMTTNINDAFVKRVNVHIYLESFSSPFVTAILGPRRVGKSEFVKHYIKQHPEQKWVVLNMDKLSERHKMISGDLQTTIEQRALQAIGQGEKIWVAIDEAQKCTELFEQIKVLYDEHKGQNVIKFILTGSASLELHNLSAESLAGRIELLNMREFTIRETAMFSHDINLIGDALLDALVTHPHDVESLIHQARPYEGVLQEALELQMVYGGLPEVIALQTDRERLRYLDQYIQSYLEKDVRKVAEIADIDLYQKLIEVLAGQTGSLRDDTRLLEGLGCARNTLKKYRRYLIATMVYHEVFPIMNDTLKRIIKSPKGYIKNNGVVSLLTGLDTMQLLKSSSQIGHRLENWFLKELQVWLDRDVKRHRICFWQTSSGTEVDFIVDRKTYVIPFEVTNSTRIDSRKLRNLATFMSKTKKATMGILIYNGEYVFKSDLNIHCISAWAIC